MNNTATTNSLCISGSCSSAAILGHTIVLMALNRFVMTSYGGRQ